MRKITNLTSEQILAVAAEIRADLKILDEAIGCYAVDFYDDEVKFQIFESGIEKIDGKLVIKQPTGVYRAEASKTVDGIKFFALTDKTGVAL